MTKAEALLGGAMAGVALIVAMLRTGDVLIYNHSPSMPVGFYIRIDEAPVRARIVTVRSRDVAMLEAEAHDFNDPNDRFIKRIAAGAGDVVCARDDTITVNEGIAAHRAERDSLGRILPRWSGCVELGDDQVLLLGDTADSFDGRYWGPVSTSLIEGVWRRL